MTGEPRRGETLVVYRWADADERAVSEARAALRHEVTVLGLSEETSSAAVLAASELIANAVEHASGPYELRVHRIAGNLVCEVLDHGPSVPELPVVDSSEGEFSAADCENSLARLPERGRGLRIVHEISCGALGVRFLGERKAMWFAMRLP